MAAVGRLGFEPPGNIVGPSLNKITITVMEPSLTGKAKGARPRVPRLPTPDSPDSPLERPGSALSRGVQITEFKDVRVNPEPQMLEEADVILDDYLSPKKLRDLAGTEDLNEVEYLELKVDTRETSLGNFGAHLPNLSQLKLSNSIIFSIRDLGSGLNNLRVLWMSRCGLDDLDGISSMQSLQELYLAYNEIRDIGPCSLLENVKILDLEGNNIDDIHQVQFLELCGNLRQLTLEGNPVCMMPTPDAAATDYNYRAAVKKYLPQLTLLDDEPLKGEHVEVRPTSAAFEEDWKLIAEFLNDGTVLGAEDDVSQTGGRPGTSVRPTTGYRPGSALKQQVNSPLRPASRASYSPLGTGSSQGSIRPLTGRPPSTGRTGSAGRPMTGMRRGSLEDPADWTDPSDLTRGKVVCGNPSKALRARARQSPVSPLSDDASSDTSSLLANYRSQKKSSSPESNSKKTDPHLKELLGEIDDWRKENEKRRASIAQEKEPQILTINHDDELTDEEESSGDEIDGSKEDEMLYASLTRQGFGDVNLSSYAESSKSPKRHQRQKAARPAASEESFDLSEESYLIRESSASSSSSLGSPNTLPGPLSSPDNLHHSHGQGSGHKGKFRLGAVVSKTSPKATEPSKPVLRTPERTSEKNHGTGAVSLVSPPSLNPRRKLPNVSLLPSKTPPK